MMKFAQIILNGQAVSSEEILRIASEISSNPAIPEWEKELYSFLREWFSDSDVVLAHTSGSTGEPKTMELPKAVMAKSAERTIEYFGLKSGDRILLSLHCRYIAGKMMAVRAIVGQMNLIAVDPSGDFELLKQQKFHFGAMVPNQVLKLLEQPSGKEKLQNIENLLIGGSSISTALEGKVGLLSSRVVSTYGMTETASHIAIRELSGWRKSAYYHSLPGISVSLTETGCLQIHLPEFIGPLQTNDLAELQSGTAFRILGRADSVIISGGIKHSPEAIEKKLEGLFEGRFVISALPDEKLGERMVLVVEGTPFPTERTMKQVKALLSVYEQPKQILFLDKFPETSSGKLIRTEIKQAVGRTVN